ncbi:MAG: amidase [Pseudomonadota bacterium]
MSNISSILEISKSLSRGDYNCIEFAKEALSHISELNKELNAFVEINEERVLEHAISLQDQLDSGQNVSLLHGVPVAIKNNFDIEGYNINACSKALHSRFATTDAACIKMLKKSGALIIGTTNMHELAYGGTGDISSYGPAKNPLDTTRIPGGSSSGSAVAVASKMVPLSLGSDTGGSVRIPAAACGVVGYKPSINLIDTGGVLPLSWTLDHVGTIANSVSDAGLGAAFLMGSTSSIRHQILSSFKEFSALPREGLDQCRIALIEIDGMPLSSDVSKVINNSVKITSTQKAVVEKESLKFSVESHVAWLNIMYPEASSFYVEKENCDYTSFSSSTRVQLEAGKHIAAVDYLKAQRFRAMFSGYFNSFFDKYDFVVMPTLPVVAPKFDDQTVTLGDKDVTIQDAMTFTNSIANMVGCPAITIPVGFDSNAMPVGLTILAPFKKDLALLEFAKKIENLFSDGNF